MAQESDRPEDLHYNIGAVARLTGIPITTLHAWERRYGFPRSSRTPGGHRLFTERDITLLRWVKSRIDSGLGTHNAILAAQQLEKEGAPAQAFPAQAVPQPPALVPLAGLKDRLSAVLLQTDLAQADQLLGEMLAFYTPEEITLNVIGPVLHQLGEEWAAGRITVATEHVASHYLRQRLLMWMVTGPRPRSTRPVVLACAPGEWHDGSLLMLGVLLRRQGMPVAYLGQNVPFEDLAQFVDQQQPGAVVMAAMLSETAQGLHDWGKWMNVDRQKVLYTFGGRAFVVQPEMKDSVPAVYLGDTIQEGFNKLLELI